MNEQDRQIKKREPPDVERWSKQMQAVRIFDELIANAYRPMSPASYTSSLWDNLLITREWQIGLIDHTSAFGITPQLQHPESLTQCDRSVLAKLRTLNKGDLARQLGRYTSPQVEAWSRLTSKIGDVLKANGRKAAVDYTVEVVIAGMGGDAGTVSRIRAIVNDHPFWNYEHKSLRRLNSANGRLAEIRIPLLAVTSERDVPYCQETADRLVAVVPAAEKVLLRPQVIS